MFEIGFEFLRYCINYLILSYNINLKDDLNKLDYYFDKMDFSKETILKIILPNLLDTSTKNSMIKITFPKIDSYEISSE